MDNYRAPIEDMAFVIDELCDVERRLAAVEQFVDLGIGPELTAALLDESAKNQRRSAGAPAPGGR